MAHTSDAILAADIGGTKTNIALVDPTRDGSWNDRCIHFTTLPSGEYAGLEALVGEFLQQHADVGSRSIRVACFGLPGPIVNGTCETSNLPWSVDSSQIGRVLGIPRVELLNDLEATGYSISALAEDELHHLNPSSGLAHNQTRAVIAAGTGLGMAIVVNDDGRWRPVASEGGHVEFAPRDDLEVELLKFLMARNGHVSVERVVSGPGIVSLYEFFSLRYGIQANPKVGAEISADLRTAPGTITRAAILQECETCVRALDLFVEQYGAVAGNLALTACATGGVYVAGGIAPKILPLMTEGRFMRSFSAKGRMSSLASRIPVCVICNELAALVGAVQYGMGLVNEPR